MHFYHSPDIWQAFPTLTAGCLYAEGVSTGVDVLEDVEKNFAKTRERLSQSSEGEMPEIAAWRAVYSQMGFKPTQYRCAAESLLRRFRKEDSLPSFHPLVDLCNSLSMAYATPIAVFDCDHFADGLEVRFAHGDEQYLDFSGETETIPEGEVIFADSENRAHARRWCFRQSKASVVSPSTERVLIVCESHYSGPGPGTGPEDGVSVGGAVGGALAPLIDEVAHGLEKYFSGVSAMKLLSKVDERFEY